MKSALAIRHVAFEDLGVLEQVLIKRGYNIRYLEAGMQSLQGDNLRTTDLLIMLGGPISANDTSVFPFIDDLLEQIAARTKASKPVLGICLGAQLIARALGAPVYPMPDKEIGWSELSLTAAGQTSCLRHLQGQPVLHWHGETYDLPDNSEHLAQTDVCRQQAFAIGRHVLGLQFHLEVTGAGLERWYIGHCVELAQAGLSIPLLRRDTERYAPRLEQCARQCFDDWLQGL